MKVPIAEVKRAWRDALAALPALAGIPIHYSPPGANLLYGTDPAVEDYKAAIWFDNTATSYERTSMRAGRQRRLVTATFPVFIQVEVMAGTVDGSFETGEAGLMAEQIAFDLWQPIDEYVADNPHLANPDLVLSATVDGDPDPRSGYTDNGFGYRMGMPVSTKFFLL